ncbi:MAG TPA: hypothetical protein VKE94_16760 [Gemmataceae bacterium]|nr:hypothetical protein [Gemmataceae bacterium]
MSWIGTVNLIRALDWYLLIIFVASSVLRLRQYRSLLRLVWLFPGRWPLLLELINKHRSILLTWGTVLPAFLALVLLAANTFACRLVWPQADLALAHLADSWQAALVIGCLATAMVCFDCYSARRVGQWDREQVEKQFDQAEYWLKSWTAPVLRFVTFGFVNPRKLVGVEIRKALVAAGRQLNWSLWWTSLQVSLRIAFGASVWLTYVWSLK